MSSHKSVRNPLPPNYFFAPSFIFESDTSKSAKLLYLFLSGETEYFDLSYSEADAVNAGYPPRKRYTEMTREEIGAWCSLSPKAVSKAIRELEAVGLVFVVKQGWGRPDCIYLHPDDLPPKGGRPQ